LEYEAVIGLEIHAQLRTRAKLFCSCPNGRGGRPNSRVCPVCLGLPGALPVLNERAVDSALAVAVALGADVSQTTGFARKSYFYPDLPKGYQITQKEQPLARGGVVELAGGARVRLRQIHLEEDAGKVVHRPDGDLDVSLINMNRCGVPLVEIVTEPDIDSVEQADALLHELSHLLVFLGVTDGRMHEGALRFDTNMSLRDGPEAALGVPTEIKNLNSFRSVRRALRSEIERQELLLEQGGSVTRETMLWDEAAERVLTMRSKEESNDYRYMPEPDLPVFTIDTARVERVRAEMPDTPDAIAERLDSRYGLGNALVAAVTASPERVALFERTVGALVPSALRTPAEVAHLTAAWVATVVPGIVVRAARDASVAGGEDALYGDELASGLAAVLAARLRGELTEATARTLLERSLRDGGPVQALIGDVSLSRIDDLPSLRETARQVLRSHEDELRRYLAGERRLRRFFMGEIMRLTEGRADPGVASAALDEELSAAGGRGR